MGIKRELFVKKLDEHFHCGICLDVFEKTTICCCGHSFCQECIYKWATKTDKKEYKLKITCPTCRQSISRDFYPVLTVDSIINSQNVHCQYQKLGCKSIFKHYDWDKHNCTYTAKKNQLCRKSLRKDLDIIESCIERLEENIVLIREQIKKTTDLIKLNGNQLLVFKTQVELSDS